MTTTADLLLADNQVADIRHNHCIIQETLQLRAKLDILTENVLRDNVDTEDIVTWLRLYGAEFDELIDDAKSMADEYREKAEEWDRVCDSTLATDSDEVIEAFNKAEKYDSVIDSLRDLIDEA